MRTGKFYRARSRLYRSQKVQENMRLKALADASPLHSSVIGPSPGLPSRIHGSESGDNSEEPERWHSGTTLIENPYAEFRWCCSLILFGCVFNLGMFLNLFLNPEWYNYELRTNLTAQQRLASIGRNQSLVAESGRPARPSGAACAKRPHGRLRRLSAELENVGEASGKPPTF